MLSDYLISRAVILFENGDLIAFVSPTGASRNLISWTHLQENSIAVRPLFRSGGCSCVESALLIDLGNCV